MIEKLNLLINAWYLSNKAYVSVVSCLFNITNKNNLLKIHNNRGDLCMIWLSNLDIIGKFDKY